VESLLISSPELANEVKKYSEFSLSFKDLGKFELSVFKYYLRSCYRCTPFGLFAGISVGSFSKETTIRLSSSTKYKKNTRLDTHFLTSFAQQILKDAEVRGALKWYANNSIYEMNGKFRFIEFRIDKDTRTHHLANVCNSEYVRLTLAQAKQGVTISELAFSLVNDEISLEDGENFVNEMINACLLVSELEPLVTGKEYHTQLLTKLKGIPAAKYYLQGLQSVVAVLKETNLQKVGLSSRQFKEVIDQVNEWQIDYDLGCLFQCDLLKPTEKCQITSQLTDELAKAISLLEKITPLPNHSNLGKFIDEFEKRYASQEIPLLTILDSDTGIGYPFNGQTFSDNAPLLTNLQLGNDTHADNKHYKSTKWSKFILSKYHQAIRNHETEIEITEDEVRTIWKDDNDMDFTPNSIYTLCSVLASSAEDFDSGNFLIYHETTSGPSAANLLGRFCYMDEELTSLTRELLKKEEKAKPDAVFAEILHIPQARLANVAMRPVLRSYEIPILTSPAVDEGHTLPLHDLMVSIENGKIFLRSKKLKKEVIPRLSTALNFSINPVPHYHFLCDLQFQGIKPNLSWDWGFLNEFPFLPRVRYGKTILSKARWILNLNDLSIDKDVKETELIVSIKRFFAQNNLPKRVTISQGDNLLPIDIENGYCLKILAKDVKKHETLILHECLFNENNLLVKGPEGSFTNEIIIPWYKQSSAKNGAMQLQRNEETVSIQRNCEPGSQWHYIKIYCGVKTAENILIDVLKPIIESLVEEGIIAKWFFIRYADPDHHIRVRFLGGGTFYAEITEKLNEALACYLQNHLIWKIQTDTYNRELERYGAENMENSETIFFYDSTATVQILSLLEGDEGDELRWQFAIKGVDEFLNSFALSLSEKKELMASISGNFLKEFNADNSETKKQLGSKYRDIRSKIDLATQTVLSEEHEFYSIWKIFRVRSENLVGCIAHLNQLYASNKLSVHKSDLIASYLHMFLNRFLRSKQRLQEMVIYDMLHQHYKSLLARQLVKSSTGSQ